SQLFQWTVAARTIVTGGAGEAPAAYLRVSFVAKEEGQTKVEGEEGTMIAVAAETMTAVEAETMTEVAAETMTEVAAETMTEVVAETMTEDAEGAMTEDAEGAMTEDAEGAMTEDAEGAMTVEEDAAETMTVEEDAAETMTVEGDAIGMAETVNGERRPEEEAETENGERRLEEVTTKTVNGERRLEEEEEEEGEEGAALPCVSLGTLLYSIHKATVVRVQDYGCFCRLGDGDKYKDGLLHISRISASGRVESVEDVLHENDPVWVKVCEVKEDEAKYSIDMRFVGQKDGEDLDANNVQADSGSGKGKGKGPEPIRIGAVQATTCSRCGARGHFAKECWAGTGKQYDMVEEIEEPEEAPVSNDRRERKREPEPAGHDPKIVKEALAQYFKRKAAGEPSSSSSSSDDKKKKKKKEKKEKKQLKKEKKELKKEKKEKKKVKEA
ncbi:unnamed protein product, partial [Polarella glacialis]